MLDFRDKKIPDQWDCSGKEKRARAIQRLRERKKESAGEGGFLSWHSVFVRQISHR